LFVVYFKIIGITIYVYEEFTFNYFAKTFEWKQMCKAHTYSTHGAEMATLMHMSSCAPPHVVWSYQVVNNNLSRWSVAALGKNCSECSMQ